MKKIIHFRLPIDDIKVKDSFIISLDVITYFLNAIKNKLGDDYEIICSPFYCTFEDKEIGENVDLDALSAEKFLEKYKIKEDSK